MARCSISDFNLWYYGTGDWRRSLEWANVRKLILRRDKRTCQECGSTRNPTVDHIIPVSKGGSRYDERNLQVLCRACHEAKHA